MAKPAPRAATNGRVPVLMAISDRRSCVESSFEDWLGHIAGRALGLQLREKDLTDRQLLDLARRSRAGNDTTVVVNERADVALAAGCDGVHLSAAGVPIRPLRRRFGKRLLIGRSTHHPEEVARAKHEGADYVIFGPVFPTPSKAAYGRPPGLAGLRRAVAHGLPVLAIGGIGPEEMAAVAAAGAAGAAGIRAFQTLDGLEKMIRAARRLWPRAASA